MEGIIIAFAQGFARVVGGAVAEYLLAPIRLQLGYVFKHHSYIDDLEKQVEDLSTAKEKRQTAVDEAKNQGYDIKPDVQNWLTDAAATIVTADNFIEGEDAANKCCFNVKSLYLRSREAEKLTRDIMELIRKNNKFIETFESRESTLNQIMEALESADINLIGVWGMDGVGKTTLAKQVMKLAEDKLFKVVMVLNISQIPNVSKIQGDIAGMLGLEFKENEAELIRADRLRKSLENHEKLLVILDNLWAKLSLEQIGIPYDRKGCKVLLTSRKHDLLSKVMDTDKNFQVKQLSDEEAWSLFKDNAGGAVESLKLRPTALQVAKKCGGLPVAIVTIAKALKGESVAVWKNALDELQRCAPMNIEGVIDDVYSCLELSYNYLKSDEMKRLFLLCAMLGSGDISMIYLLQYAMGLNLFQQNLSLGLATNKLVTLVKKLKDSSLLLDDEDRYSHLSEGQFFFEPDESKLIRMHDVVRDVARSIASKDPHQFVLKEAGGFEEWQRRGDESLTCTHISLSDSNIKGLPERLVCPKLQFFFLGDYNYPRCLKIPSTFFEEMKKLKVLHLIHMDLPVLPSSFNTLINLQTLCLNRCALGDVAMIGALKKLRVLSFEGSNIKQLPTEMMQLTDLRVLDLSASSGLRVIPRNLISSLSRLEYLHVDSKFDEWGLKRFDNDGETNACLSELRNLSNLTILAINTKNLNGFPKDLVFETFIRYKIVVGLFWKYKMGLDWKYEIDNQRYSRVLKLGGIKSFHDLVNCFSKLLKTTQFLGLEGLDDGKHSLCEFGGEGFPELKNLFIERSGGLQYVFKSMEWAPSHCAFPILKSLHLKFLINLDAVWYGPIPKGSFGRLRELSMINCPSLKYVMLLSTTPEKEFVFPHLKDISLEFLLELISFFSVETSLTMDSSTRSDAQKPFFNQKVVLPSLESLEMTMLDKLGTVWQDQVHAESFRKLKSLKISYCGSLRNVFLLRSLETLTIKDCNSLDDIFYIESKEEIQQVNAAAALRELSFQNLRRLKSIWNKEDPQAWATFQNLRVLKVSRCPLLTHVFPGRAAKGLKNLEILEVSGCGLVEEIVADENGDIATPSLFPKLTFLKLDRLGNLKCIYGGTASHAFQWPLLKDLQVCHCGKVDILFQGIDSEAGAGINGVSAQRPLFFVQKDTFPDLEKLTLTGTAKTWEGQFSHESFGKLQHLEVKVGKNIFSAVISSTVIPILHNVKHLKLTICNSGKEVIQLDEQPCFSHLSGSAWIRENLSSLEVSDCKNLVYLLAPSMAKTTVQLEELNKENCSEGNTELNVAVDDGLVFAKLERVELRNLRNLRSFGSTRYPFKFPSLKVMTVTKCGAMESFCGTFSGSTKLEIWGLPQLTQLCMQISGLYQNLQNIQALNVTRCENLIYLVTPSVIKSLVQLKELCVISCDVMTEVVGAEGDDATYNIVFPKLKSLRLYGLPKLRSFCSARNYTFNFPSLEDFDEGGCNQMEFFCEGGLNTPRLVRFKYSKLKGDLNTAIKKRALEKVKKRITWNLSLKLSHLTEKSRDDPNQLS